MWRLADGTQDGPYTLCELRQYSHQGHTSGEVTSTITGVTMRITKLLSNFAMPADDSRVTLKRLQGALATAQEVERGRVAQLVPLLDDVSGALGCCLLMAWVCLSVRWILQLHPVFEARHAGSIFVLLRLHQAPSKACLPW
jgi:hypothetical protein